MSTKATARARSRPGHVTHGSVWSDLGLPPEKAQALQVKAELHRALLALIARRRYSRKQLSHLLGEPAPRVSELLHGRIASTSIERLLRYASRLGCAPHIVLRPRRAA